MRKFVYPAVLYFDEEAQSYTIAIHDLALYTEGSSVEVATNNAQGFLNNYLECALKYDIEIPEASNFSEVISKYPKNLVVLVESKIDDKNKAI